VDGVQGISRWIHIVFGFAGLAAFWIPILTRKGSPLHRGAGRVFSFCAAVVLLSAGLSIGLLMTRLAAAGKGPADSPGTWSGLVFLAYLAWVTWLFVHHGRLVLRSKQSPPAAGTVINRGLALSAMVASGLIVAWALVLRPPNMIVLLALSPIGFLSGRGMLAYYRGNDLSPRAWLYEHLGAMIGAGIAFHTAFAVFGSRQLLGWEPEGLIGVLPWILPALVGLPASAIWTRHYRKQFDDPPRSLAG
jgi:hypothetical protein